MTLLFNGILALTAVAGAAFVSWQLVLMRESNKLTRESLEFTKKSAAESDLSLARRERPWVLIDDVKMNFYPGPTRAEAPMLVTLTVKNLGVLPANDVTMIWASTLLPELPEDFDFSIGPQKGFLGSQLNKIASHIGMGPGQTFVGVTKFDARGPFVTQMKEGGFRLYMYGEINYSDPSGGKHRTEFCRYFLPALLDKAGLVTNILWNACPVHNASN